MNRNIRLLLSVCVGAALLANVARSVADNDIATVELSDAALIAAGVERLLAMQEGPDNAEWPYEGVYRVRGRIPIGYRVGGTAICASALLRAPGYDEDEARKEAVARAVSFILHTIDDPLMSPEYDGGYDVRGWGYTYALAFLLELQARGAQPLKNGDAINDAVRFFIDAVQRTEIPDIGGWNYARRGDMKSVSPPAPFMTGPTVQALMEAKRQKYEVDEAVVNRALDSLEKARTRTGAFQYSGANGERSAESVPGSVGRMLVAELTLYLAGRSDAAKVRSAIDAFIVHWEWLDKRRAQQGTHVPPYGIAPYYFYFAHYYAAQGIELLPERERGEYRRRLRELIMKNRLDDGTWNDRVFPRSANFGTAMCMMALMMKDGPPLARWDFAN